MVSLKANKNDSVGGSVLPASNIKTEQRNVVIKQSVDPSVEVVANNIAVIKKLASNIANIIATNNMRDDISELIAIKDKIDTILNNSASIISVATKIDDIIKTASIDGNINIVAGGIAEIKELSKLSSQIRMVYSLRSMISKIAGMQEALNNIVRDMPSIKGVEAKLDEITLCFDHMLAIEIVAQNIELLRYFNIHIDSFIELLEMKDELILFGENIELARKLVDIVTNLPEKLEEIKAEFDNIKDNVVADFNDKTNKVLEIYERLDEVNNNINALDDKYSNVSYKYIKANNELVKTTNLAIKAIKDEKIESINNIDRVAIDCFDGVNMAKSEADKLLSLVREELKEPRALKLAIAQRNWDIAKINSEALDMVFIKSQLLDRFSELTININEVRDIVSSVKADAISVATDKEDIAGMLNSVDSDNFIKIF